MELVEVLDSGSVLERLEYVAVLLEMLGEQDRGAFQGRKALVGGAVFWLTSVDETLCGLNPGVRGVRYKTRRANEEGGKVLRALRLARNEMAHGSALATQDGLQLPAAFPWFLGLQFISADRLAEHYRSRHESDPRAHDLSLYAEFVAGRSPDGVVTRAYEWLVETTTI